MEETDVSITPPRTWAVCVPAVADPLRYSMEQTTVRRTAPTLLNPDRTKSFDCPGCAWPQPDPAHRHRDEYCENDGKHDHPARLPERTTSGTACATATAPRSDGP
ncbi:hypothetical protein [Streptomyces sp. NPDC002520]